MVAMTERSADREPGAGGNRPEPGEPWASPTGRWARNLGMLVYPVTTAVGVGLTSHGARAAAGYAVVAVFIGCFLALTFTFDPRRMHPRHPGLILALIVLLAAAFPFAHGFALYLAPAVGAVAAVAWRRRARWILAAGALLGIAVPALAPAWRTGVGWFGAPMIVFTVLAACWFHDLVSANRDLAAARAQISLLASEAERNRIARDLHDLLGHSLTAITVQASLVRRLAAANSPALLEEARQTEQLARRTLTDVRAAVSGFREVTLAGELARGRELLRAAGVTADLPTATDMIEPEYDELFGWAVREGITNITRHADAHRATVALSPTTVEILDDGTATIHHPRAHGPGNGLAGLHERAAACGASVQAGPLDPHGWHLRVDLETRRARA